jgi:hypothetical protein
MESDPFLLQESYNKQMIRNPWAWFRKWIPGRPETTYPLLSFDGLPWKFPESPRIVAIGDLHGDLTALAALLLEAKVVDETGQWIAGQTQLVLLGDLMGGHADSRLLLDFVMRLERQALSSGGNLFALFGNHDLLPVQGDVSKLTAREKTLFSDYPIEGSKKGRAKHAFRGNSVYAKWTRSRNALVQIGDTLFVHAGLDRWALECEIGQLNATIRSWIRFWQQVDDKPPVDTRWTVGKREMKRGSRWEVGPLWNRTYRVKLTKRGNYKHQEEEGLTREELEKALHRSGAMRLVIGHSPVDGGALLLEHPYYGNLVIMTDTRISDKDGTLSALELTQSGPSILLANKRKAGIPIRDATFEALTQNPLQRWWTRWQW